MANENSGPNGILSAAKDFYKPTEGWRFLLTPEEQATVDLADTGVPDGIGGAQPPGWGYRENENSAVPIVQIDPDRLAARRPGPDAMRGVLGRISTGEGTDDADAQRHQGFGSGYDATYGYQATPKPLSGMTLNEVDHFQEQMPDSTAVGKYQFMRNTLGDLKKNLGLTGDEIFSPDLQDRMGRQLLRRRGWNDYVDGKIDAGELQRRLGNEWDSIAMPGTGLTGTGHQPRTTGAQIQDAIGSIVRYK